MPGGRVGGTELVNLREVQTSTAVRHQESWSIDQSLPPDWGDLVGRLGAGFFHSPLGLRAGAPGGEPCFLRYHRDGEVVGIAVGVRTPCRLGGAFRHLYFPTWPAFADDGIRDHALAKLVAAFRSEGVAEVVWDSFDAAGRGPFPKTGTRWEYLLDLTAIAESSTWPDSSGHRRTIRRGEKSGWTLRELAGPEARATLAAVMDSAMQRHARRGVHHSAAIPQVVIDPAPSGAPWDVRTYAAFSGNDLLAAILIGRCGGRAYYLVGGATEAGYSLGGSTWLQAQVISRLADAGFIEYNLGGASRGAPDQGDPDNGLHRFKAGFGAAVIPCAGDRWPLMPAHLRGHRLFGWAAGLVP